MKGFLEQCVSRYLELANISKDTLKPSKTPSLDDQNFSTEDWTEKRNPSAHSGQRSDESIVPRQMLQVRLALPCLRSSERSHQMEQSL